MGLVLLERVACMVIWLSANDLAAPRGAMPFGIDESSLFFVGPRVFSRKIAEAKAGTAGVSLVTISIVPSAFGSLTGGATFTTSKSSSSAMPEVATPLSLDIFELPPKPTCARELPKRLRLERPPCPPRPRPPRPLRPPRLGAAAGTSSQGIMSVSLPPVAPPARITGMSFLALRLLQRKTRMVTSFIEPTPTVIASVSVLPAPAFGTESPAFIMWGVTVTIVPVGADVTVIPKKELAANVSANT